MPTPPVDAQSEKPGTQQVKSEPNSPDRNQKPNQQTLKKTETKLQQKKTRTTTRTGIQQFRMVAARNEQKQRLKYRKRRQEKKHDKISNHPTLRTPWRTRGKGDANQHLYWINMLMTGHRRCRGNTLRKIANHHRTGRCRSARCCDIMLRKEHKTTRQHTHTHT